MLHLTACNTSIHSNSTDATRRGHPRLSSARDSRMKNAQCEHVVCDAHDQPAARRRAVASAWAMSSRASPWPRWAVDPRACGSGSIRPRYCRRHMPRSGRCGRGRRSRSLPLRPLRRRRRRRVFLEQCKIARIGLILDGEVIRVAYRWLPCRRLGGERLFERGGVVEVGAENAAAPDLYAQPVVSIGSH